MLQSFIVIVFYPRISFDALQPRAVRSRAKLPVFELRQLLSWSARLQLSTFTLHQFLSVVVYILSAQRRGGLFSSCHRFAAPAPVVEYIAQFTQLTCLRVHVPSVCGARCTGTSHVVRLSRDQAQ